MFARETITIVLTINNEFKRLGLVALMGSAIGYATYELIYYFMPFEPRATIAWALAFEIGVLRQHYLHQRFTFKLEVAPAGSLRRAFIMYSASAIIGSSANYFLTKVFGVNHRLVWFICLAITASISLIFLKSWVFRASKSIQSGSIEENVND